MSDTEPEKNGSNATGNRRGRLTAEPSREMCICGHRATVHAAYRYGCQAPGTRKGFCQCMRFIARNSPVGKRLRAVERTKSGTEAKSG